MTIRKVYKLVHCCCRSSHLHLANLTVWQVSSASFSSLSPLYVFFPSAYFFCYYLCVTSFGPPEIYNKIFHYSLEALQSILSLYLTQERRKKNFYYVQGFFLSPAAVSFFCRRSYSILFHPIFSIVEPMSMRSLILIFKWMMKKGHCLLVNWPALALLAVSALITVQSLEM